VALSLGTLSEGAQIFTGEAIFCSNCQASYNFYSTIIVENDQQLWQCEFCNTKNNVMIDKEEIPTVDTIDYMLDPPKLSETSDQNIVVFCIDTSGSMCCTSEISGDFKIKKNKNQDFSQFIEQGANQYLPRQKRGVSYISRLQCVQAAIESQLETFQSQFPNKRVVLVEFNNDVTVHISKEKKFTIAGDKLNNKPYLQTVGSEIVNNLDLTKTVSECREDLSSIICNLTENGQTALGPALLTAISIASTKPGSSVILCTDGLANIGLGSLEGLTDEEDDKTEQFYNDLANFAKNNGVVVNILSIEGQNVNVEYIGKVAMGTNGFNDIVDPLKLTKNFNFLLENPIIATDVVVKMFIHLGLKWFNEENPINNYSCLRNVGIANKESSITFEFGMSDVDIGDLKSLPFQVQIHYTRLDGAKCIRVMSKKQEVTEVREVAEENLNVGVIGLHSMQQTAKNIEEGDYTKARLKTITHQKLVKRALKSKKNKTKEDDDEYVSWMVEAEKMDTMIRKKSRTRSRRI